MVLDVFMPWKLKIRDQDEENHALVDTLLIPPTAVCHEYARSYSYFIIIWFVGILAFDIMYCPSMLIIAKAPYAVGNLGLNSISPRRFCQCCLSSLPLISAFYYVVRPLNQVLE